jgi:hypothetical protein
MLLRTLVVLLLISAAIYGWLGWLNHRRFGGDNPYHWTYRAGHVAFYVTVFLGVCTLLVAVTF